MWYSYAILRVLDNMVYTVIVDTALLTCLLLSNLLLIVVCLSLVRRLRRWEQGIGDTFREWVTATDEKTPSPFAQLVDKVSAVVAGHVGNSVTAAIRGALGGTMKGINAEEQGALIDGSPALGLVSTLAPKLARKLGKNPQAVAVLQSLLGGLTGGNGSRLGEIVEGRRHRD